MAKIGTLNEEYKQILLDKFVSYVKINTQSNSELANEGICPSTQNQFELAELLKSQLMSFGIENVVVDKNCYVYACIPASPGFEKETSFCLLAHLDTSEEVSGQGVKPCIHTSFPNNKIILSNGIVLDGAEDEQLLNAINNGETIITSDGNTLLGADDKAGVSEIMTALEYVLKNNIAHGSFEIIFSPDEETGHGMDNVPLDMLKSSFAYTVDGGDIGQLEIECFNAAKAEVIFVGKATHTGNAKEKGMINGNCVVADFISQLPQDQRPETTCGYEGFFAVIKTEASIEEAKVEILLRDFQTEGLDQRKNLIKELAKDIADKWGCIYKVNIVNQYENMKNKIQEFPVVIQKLMQAYKESEVASVNTPIRGGTDGSTLTKLGIPTPNIFTGGHNFHSRLEWASLQQMCKATEVIINLISKK